MISQRIEKIYWMLIQTIKKMQGSTRWWSGMDIVRERRTTHMITIERTFVRCKIFELEKSTFIFFSARVLEETKQDILPDYN